MGRRLYTRHSRSWFDLLKFHKSNGGVGLQTSGACARVGHCHFDTRSSCSRCAADTIGHGDHLFGDVIAVVVIFELLVVGDNHPSF